MANRKQSEDLSYATAEIKETEKLLSRCCVLIYYLPVFSASSSRLNQTEVL